MILPTFRRANRKDIMDRQDTKKRLTTAYNENTFGLTRRRFVVLATTAGISAVGGMLVFPEQKADAFFTPVTGSPSWPSFPEGRIRFTVHSDTHVGAGAQNNYRDKIPAAFEALYSATEQIDAHFFVGDSADSGNPDQYTELAELLNANVRKPVGIVMGNHEYYYWGGHKENAQREFTTFLSSKLQVAGSFQIPGGPDEGQTDCDFVVGGDGTPGTGYHVLALSAHPGGYDNSWYGDRQDWIRSHVAAAVAENSSKPIFLLTHHPFGNTVWYSTGGSWNGQFGTDISDRTGNDDSFYRELAASYPQIIHFSGHTHIPLADPRSIYQDDGFTLIQTATFANNFWMSQGGADEAGGNGGHPDAGQDANQCELVEIDPNTHIVTVYRMDFRDGRALGTSWTIDPRIGTGGFHYAHDDMAARSLPPLIDAEAAITIPEESITADGASFSLTAERIHPDRSGLDDDVVISYRIEIYDIASQNAKIYDVRYMSDYYKATCNQPATFTRPLFGATLSDDSEYLVRSFAQETFEKESFIGETTFRTAVKAAPPLEEDPLLAIDLSTGSHEDISTAAHMSMPTGALSYETDPVFGVKVGVFDGSTAVGYEFAASDYAAVAQAETIEVLFQFTEVPTGSGYCDLFSSAEHVGQDLSYYGPLDPSSDNPLHANPLLHQYMNVGAGYKSTNAVVLPDTWYHLITTFDGETMKYYLNGDLVSQLNNPGSIPAPSATPTRWYLGSDTNSSGGPQMLMKGKVAFARLTPGVAVAEQVTDRYVASAPLGVPAIMPDESMIGSAVVGTSYTLPPVSFTDAAGIVLQAIPFVTDPTGLDVVVTRELGTADSSIDDIYRFVPDKEGAYTVGYRAGYAHRPTFGLSVRTAATDPGTGTDPLPDQGGDGAPSSDGGLVGHPGQTTSDSTAVRPKPLAQTGDSSVLGNALMGFAAAAGAIAYTAKSLLPRKTSEENDDGK